VGDPILQPGAYDGGKMEDTVANLLRFIPLRTLRVKDLSPGGKIKPGDVNVADAAVARLAAGIECDASPVGLPAPKGVAPAKLGMVVQKSGRMTGLTRGKVKALNCTLKVGYEWDRIGIFTGQILCTCKSQGGDSGSLVVDERNRAVGLLFAGSDTVTVATPVDIVLKGLQLAFPS